MEGGNKILLYIINLEKYKKHLKDTGIGFIPNFLLPRFKPRIIGEITKDNIQVVKIAGINLKPMDSVNLKHSEAFIESILRLKDEKDAKVYIEDSNKFTRDFIKAIEESTGLIFSSGDNIRMQNISTLIKEVYKGLGRDHNSVDTLIICDNKEKIIDTIKQLSSEINFFTIVGLEEDLKDEVYYEVLEYTGVSIFQPKNIDKIMKNYGTIINYNDEVYIDKLNIRNQCVIIDFSRNKPLKSLINTKKNVFYVEDIFFKTDLESKWIDPYINPELCEGLGLMDSSFSKIYVDNKLHSLKKYINSEIKIKGRI